MAMSLGFLILSTLMTTSSGLYVSVLYSRIVEESPQTTYMVLSTHVTPVTSPTTYNMCIRWVMDRPIHVCGQEDNRFYDVYSDIMWWLNINIHVIILCCYVEYSCTFYDHVITWSTVKNHCNGFLDFNFNILVYGISWEFMDNMRRVIIFNLSHPQVTLLRDYVSFEPL